MTAIAAVIALSSTPLLAQSTEPETTAAPTAEPAPAPAADPLAPAPTVETPTVSEPAAPAATRTTRAKTTATRTTATKTARAKPAPARTPATARPAAAAPAVAAPAPVAPPAAEQPAKTEPIVPVAAAVAANGPAAPVEQPSAIDSLLANDEALPIAGGVAGLGILALTGLGIASRRRRRRREAEEAEWQEYVENTPAALGEDMAPERAEIAEPQRATIEPTFVRAFDDAPAAAPAPAPVVAPPAAVVAAPAVAAAAQAEPTGPATALPEDFDLSRFGPHVQAAYKGPTPDNPSLSLKYRLRRATALDQMARKRGTAPVAARPAPTPAARPAMASQSNGEFLLRRAAGAPNLKPEYSK